MTTRPPTINTAAPIIQATTDRLFDRVDTENASSMGAPVPNTSPLAAVPSVSVNRSEA